MQKYRVDIPPSVINEIEHCAEFIAQDSVAAALRWYQGIEEKIQTLDINPARCPVAYESRFCDYEIRHLIFGDYRILFRIEGQIVQVLRVQHGARERTPVK